MNKLIKGQKYNLRDFGILVALLVIVTVLSVASPHFRSIDNFLSLLRQSSINGFIAFGMTCVIITGSIDLSVGSILALTTALCAAMIKGGIPVGFAFMIAIIAGTILGLINGIIVTRGKLQPFIVTLVSMIIYRGFTLIFTNGRPISNLGDSKLLYFLGKGTILGIPFPIILLVLVFLLFVFLLDKTTFGRKVYAIGSNSESARLAGVNVDRTKTIVFGICGCMASLSGLILLSRLGSAQPTMGDGYELDAIAAVALGGTSMNGGRGSIWGTMIGVLLIAVLNNGLNILGVSSYWQSVVKGAVIMVAVLSDRKRY